MTPDEKNNEEVSDLERRYEALRERMRALFDAYPDMIFRVGDDTRILDFHAADEANLLARPEDFLGRKLEAVFDPEFTSKATTLIRRALETNEIQTLEYSLTLHGRTMHFESRLVPSGRDEVLSIVRDITVQRSATEKLKLTEARLNRAQEVAKIGSWERDLTTDAVWWSDETCRMLQIDPEIEKPSLQTFLAKLHPDDRPHVMDTVTEAVAQRRSYEAHHRVLLPDGSQRVMNSRAHMVLDDEGYPVRLVGTIQDVTERIELEREILAIGEQERERVGRDLHDGLGQTLTGISLSLKALANRLERGQDTPLDMLRQIEGHVQEALNETRRVSRLLSPRMAGLAPALEALVRQFDHAGARCTMHGSATHAEHEPEIETHLYRIAQEAVSNAVRHSGARRIELRYGCNGSTIRLEVVDDGVGLPQQQDSEGIGLRNMRYRVHMINGNLEVERRRGGGTRIVCSCPCRVDGGDIRVATRHSAV